ncbi:MAG: carbonic anhydrase [Actinomycetaceae bacterium]|nr:carbonic anhydrase [Actinomycetaceae bacterium]
MANLKSLLARNQTVACSQQVSIDCSATTRTRLLNAGQQPELILVSCADSRVIPEVIFNCGLGDILMTRDAGNMIGDAEYATIHYGVFSLGVTTIAVMGHSNCGAVTAALSENNDPYLAPVLDNIRASIKAEQKDYSEAQLDVNAAAKLNVIHQVNWLTGHEILQPLVSSGQITVHGLYYDQETGLVEKLI